MREVDTGLYICQCGYRQTDPHQCEECGSISLRSIDDADDETPRRMIRIDKKKQIADAEAIAAANRLRYEQESKPWLPKEGLRKPVRVRGARR